MLIRTNGEQETINLGKKLAELLVPGTVVFLTGELGSGKTQVVKGVAEALGVNSSVVQSPAYDLINEYDTGEGKHTLYHMDFYRMEGLSPDEHEWIREYGRKEGILMIEWAERVPEGLFPERLEIRFRDNVGSSNREIEVRAIGEGYVTVVSELRSFKYS